MHLSVFQSTFDLAAIFYLSSLYPAAAHCGSLITLSLSPLLSCRCLSHFERSVQLRATFANFASAATPLTAAAASLPSFLLLFTPFR